MNPIEKLIIDQANLLCKNAFMDFPDYDPENPFTNLADALTVFIFDAFQDNDIDSAEIYDFINERLKEPDYETHEEDAHGFLTGDFTEGERDEFKK